jgi:hypothetical protein
MTLRAAEQIVLGWAHTFALLDKWHITVHTMPKRWRAGYYAYVMFPPADPGEEPVARIYVNLARPDATLRWVLCHEVLHIASRGATESEIETLTEGILKLLDAT